MQGGVHHALEFGTPVVGRRLARFDIFGHDLPALGFAVALRLPALVRDGEVVFGLPVRGDAQIKRGADGAVLGHSGALALLCILAALTAAFGYRCIFIQFGMM